MSADNPLRDSPTELDSAPPASPAPARRPAALSLVLLIVLLAAGVSYAYAAQRQTAARAPLAPTTAPISPTATLPSTPAPQVSAAEVAATLRARYAAFVARPVAITYGGRTWRPTLAELGAQLDIDAATRASVAARQARAPLDQQPLLAQPGLVLDEAAMRRYLLARGAEVARPAVDAQLTLQGATAQATPAQVGLEALVDETMRDLGAALRTLRPHVVPLRTRALAPRLGDDALLAPQQTLQAFLQAPLTLRVGKQRVTWTVDEIAQLLRVRRVGAQLAVQVDEQALAQRLRALSIATETGGARPRVDWNNGALAIAKPGKPSTGIDEAQALALVLAALPTAERTLTLPLSERQPSITEQTLQQLGITELVSLGQSDFSGSASYRITNIKAGLKLLDGLLIAPGEEFSFNRAVGQINAANGFVEGYAIVQNRTQLEWGGGICQDSTTLFRAAFWAGLPITERNQHSFYIKWYDKYGFGPEGDGSGLDAAIFTGVKDLRFVNDTGGWLLIQTTVDTKRTLAEVRLYGTKPDRSVRMVSRLYDRTAAPTRPRYLPDASVPPGRPKQSDTARGGMTIDVDRIITLNGVEQQPERFRTIYKPWPDIFLYNPADRAQDAQPSPTPAVEGAPVDPTPPADAPPLVEPTPPSPPADAPPAAEPTPEPPPAEAPLVEPTPEPPPEAPPLAEPTPAPSW